MKVNIAEVKKVAQEMERTMAVGNKIELYKLMDKMIHVCQEIKNELEETQRKHSTIKLEKINTIPFMYKPILKKNYYEGTYLEDFGQQRTSDLKATKVLDKHNEFWKNHEVQRGNVFGSIPIELMGRDAIMTLKGYGWDEVDVEVFEIKGRQCSIKEMVEYCELNYTKFLMVTEKSTGAELILHFMV